MKRFLVTFSAVLCAAVVAFYGYETYRAALVSRDADNRAAAYLTNAIASATPVRLVVDQIWQMDGALPCNDGRYGPFAFEQPQPTRTHPAARVDLTGCGEITISVVAHETTPAGLIRLRGREINGALQWECNSPSYEVIESLHVDCDYVPASSGGVEPLAVAATRTPAPPNSRAGATSGSACATDVALYRTVFADTVENRVPNTRLAELGTGRSEVYFFTEVIGGAGTTVTHEWFHDGTSVATVPFEIDGDRWRTWSSKDLGGLGEGRLHVEVREGDCLVGQQSILIADRDVEALAFKSGAMSPHEAVEVALASTQLGERRLTSALSLTPAGTLYRFDDGDTPLLRAVRTRNKIAIYELIALANERESRNLPRGHDIFHDYDAGGRRAIDLARDMGLEAVVWRLEEAMWERRRPPWVVARSAFTLDMQGDEPAHCRNEFYSDESSLTFFAEVMGMNQRNVSHQWVFDGKVMHTVDFRVRSDRWTTVSTAPIPPGDIGWWSVRVVDAKGDVLHSKSIARRLMNEINEGRRRTFADDACRMDFGGLKQLALSNAPIATLDYLLDRGVYLGGNGRTALMDIALEGSNISLMRWLIDREIVDDLSSPLVEATKRGDGGMVLYLLAQSAGPNDRDWEGSAPLVTASVYGQTHITELLLEAGADPNAGAAALPRAVYNCDDKATRLLLEHGADPARMPQGNVPVSRMAESCIEDGAWDAEATADLVQQLAVLAE